SSKAPSARQTSAGAGPGRAAAACRTSATSPAALAQPGTAAAQSAAPSTACSTSQASASERENRGSRSSADSFDEIGGEGIGRRIAAEKIVVEHGVGQLENRLEARSFVVAQARRVTVDERGEQRVEL